MLTKEVLFSLNAIREGKGLDLVVEPLRIKLCRVSPLPTRWISAMETGVIYSTSSTDKTTMFSRQEHRLLLKEEG